MIPCMGLNVRVLGSGPRIVFAHGQMSTGEQTWRKQFPLAERWTVVVPDMRGYEPGAEGPIRRPDFEEEARDIKELLEDGAHLVGHSYGAMGTMFAATHEPALVRSLTLVEPPAFSLMRGHAGVEKMIARHEALYRTHTDPESFMRAFFDSIGVTTDRIPSPLPAPLERTARMLMTHRLPWDGDPPVDELKDAPFAKLVVTGGSDPDMEATADVLTTRLGPRVTRVVVEGRGHLAQRAEGFNDVLERFLAEAERGAA